MTQPTRALRYMTRFRCIAERCEDTCCGGLRIPVGEPQLQRLREAAAASGEGDWVEQGLEPDPEGPPHARAFLLARADGNCAFFGEDRLCSLQKRYGEPVLSNACSLFPRVLEQRGTHLEVSGMLGCPEVARLCLLAEDGVEPVPAPEGLLPRLPPLLAMPDSGSVGYALGEALRQVALRLLDSSGLPLGSWLLVLAHLAAQLDSLHRQGGPPGQIQANAEQLLHYFQQPGTLQALHQDFARLQLPGGSRLSLLVVLLRARLESGQGERFNGLGREVLQSLGVLSEESQDLEEAWRKCTERQEWLRAWHGARTRQYFHHYCANHLWSTPFNSAPELVGDVFRLSLRVALMWMVLVGHPTVVGLCEGREPAGEHSLDSAAVESFQVMSKYMLHSQSFKEASDSLASGQPLESLQRVMLMASLLREVQLTAPAEEASAPSGRRNAL
jgi:lysine-N-methylase